MASNKNDLFTFRMTHKMAGWLQGLADDSEMGRAEYLRMLILKAHKEKQARWRTNAVVKE